MADFNDVLEIVHSEGYWRVVLRPTQFHKARLRDKAHCQRAVYNAAVGSASGHYPTLVDRPTDEGTDWIGTGVNVLTVIEYWRFFQSGQFVHHIATKEDHMGRLGLWHPQFFVPGEGRRYLAITATVHLLTDLLEFAARLAYGEILVPSASLTIEINRMDGRQLTFMMPGRRLPEVYWFKDDRIELTRALAAENLIGRSDEIAIELATDLFSRAGWNAPWAILAEDQRRYKENRR